MISQWYLMRPPILHQKVRSFYAVTFLAAGAIALLVIAVLAQPGVPAESGATEADLLFTVPVPSLLCTGMIRPLLFFLP